MRVVLVGCGSMGRVWLDCATEIGGIEIVGLCDIDLSRADDFAQRYAPEAEYSTDLKALLRSCRPDAVFDTVVPEARFAVVRDSLAAGCDVLSEKPMAGNMADAREMVRLARETGHIHAIIQNRRYLGSPRRIRRLLDSGLLGPVTGIYCDFFIGPHFGGFREQMEHPLLLDMAIHTFDSARQMTGLDARTAYCQEWNPPNSWFKHGAAAVVLFEMDGGAVFCYRGSWCAEGLPTSWESEWRIVCERGTLLWDGAGEIRAERALGREGMFSETSSVVIPAPDPSDRMGGHRGVIEEFLDSVRTGATPETAGEENIKSLAMVFAATESAGKQAKVKLGI